MYIHEPEPLAVSAIAAQEAKEMKAGELPFSLKLYMNVLIC